MQALFVLSAMPIVPGFVLKQESANCKGQDGECFKSCGPSGLPLNHSSPPRPYLYGAKVAADKTYMSEYNCFNKTYWKILVQTIFMWFEIPFISKTYFKI